MNFYSHSGVSNTIGLHDNACIVGRDTSENQLHDNGGLLTF